MKRICAVPVGLIHALRYPGVTQQKQYCSGKERWTGQAVLISFFTWYMMSGFWSCYKNAFERKKEEGSIHFERPFHAEWYGTSQIVRGTLAGERLRLWSSCSLTVVENLKFNSQCLVYCSLWANIYQCLLVAWKQINCMKDMLLFQTLMCLGQVTNLFYDPPMDQASDTANREQSHCIPEAKLTTDPAPWAAMCLHFSEELSDALWQTLGPCQEIPFLQYLEVRA